MVWRMENEEDLTLIAERGSNLAPLSGFGAKGSNLAREEAIRWEAQKDLAGDTLNRRGG
jgi:hypothetical protein